MWEMSTFGTVSVCNLAVCILALTPLGLAGLRALREKPPAPGGPTDDT